MIRRAEKADIQELTEALTRFHAESSFSVIPHDFDHCLRLFSHMVDSPDHILLVVDEGGIKGGAALEISSYWFNPSIKIAYEIFLYLEPELRGKSTGRSLYGMAEAEAVGAGADVVCFTDMPSTHTGAGKLLCEYMGYELSEKLYRKRLWDH